MGIKLITEKCEETIKWLDANTTAEKDEFEYQKKELEKVCTPIITKRYQAGGMQVVECPVVCQEVCPVVPQAVMHPLHLVDQLPKKLINRTKYARIRSYPAY